MGSFGWLYFPNTNKCAYTSGVKKHIQLVAVQYFFKSPTPDRFYVFIHLFVKKTFIFNAKNGFLINFS